MECAHCVLKQNCQSRSQQKYTTRENYLTVKSLRTGMSHGCAAAILTHNKPSCKLVIDVTSIWDCSLQLWQFQPDFLISVVTGLLDPSRSVCWDAALLHFTCFKAWTRSHPWSRIPRVCCPWQYRTVKEIGTRVYNLQRACRFPPKSQHSFIFRASAASENSGSRAKQQLSRAKQQWAIIFLTPQDVFFCSEDEYHPLYQPQFHDVQVTIMTSIESIP